MMRASASIERPLVAARTRSLVFTPSSRLRIVMLAMVVLLPSRFPWGNIL